MKTNKVIKGGTTALQTLSCYRWKEVSAQRWQTKWFTRVIVAAAIIDTLDSLKLNYLKVSSAKPKELAEAKRALLASN